jgi:hypothetical protein
MEMSWVAPTVTLDLMKAILSACWARLGSRLENHAPLSPYCFQVRCLEAKSLFHAALGGGLDALQEGRRHRLAGQALQLRLVVVQVQRGGRAVLVQPDHGLDLAREVRLLGGQRVDQFGSGGGIDVAETGDEAARGDGAHPARL